MEQRGEHRVARLEYRGVGVEGLGGRRADGAWAMVFGVGAGVCTYWFWGMRGVSPFEMGVFVTFVLVAVIPILALAGVVRGVEAVLGGRQVVMGAGGLALSVGALGVLGRLLVG